MFSSLFCWSTPHDLDVCKFKVWVEGLSILEHYLRSSKLKERCTKSKDIGWLLVELQIILVQFFEAIVNCCLICREAIAILLCFPGSLKLFDHR